MTNTLYSPLSIFDDVRQFADTVDYLLSTNFPGQSRARSVSGATVSVPMNIYDTGNAYTLYAYVPGVNPDKIQVRVHENRILLDGEFVNPMGGDTTPNGKEGPHTTVLLKQAPEGSFHREVTLPDAIDADKVEARYDFGVLCLTLPKSSNTQPRQIKVQTPNQLQSGQSS